MYVASFSWGLSSSLYLINFGFVLGYNLFLSIAAHPCFVFVSAASVSIPAGRISRSRRRNGDTVHQVVTLAMKISAPQIVMRQPTALSRECPSTSSKFVETAGVTTAECAAVCCCWPCGLLDLVVTAFVKLPAGLCRRAIKNKQRKRWVRRLCTLPQRHDDDYDLRIHPVDEMMIPWLPESSPSAVVSEYEKEMWAVLCNTGFWRNPSAREMKICLFPETKMDSIGAFNE